MFETARCATTLVIVYLADEDSSTADVTMG